MIAIACATKRVTSLLRWTRNASSTSCTSWWADPSARPRDAHDGFERSVIDDEADAFLECRPAAAHPVRGIRTSSRTSARSPRCATRTVSRNPDRALGRGPSSYSRARRLPSSTCPRRIRNRGKGSTDQALRGGLKPSPVRSQSLRLKRGPSWVEPTFGSSVSPLGCTQVRKMTPDAEVLRYDCSSYPRCMTISPELAPNLQELFGGSPRSPRTHSERFQEGLHGSRR